MKDVTTLDDSVLSENKFQDEENDNTLLIFMLSYMYYLQPKIKLRPLRRFLTQDKIVFSLKDGLSCLRRKLIIKLLSKH